ncbi:MAG: GntR family transcriptional regulator [Armatimonadota bacterium]|nr:GntR family transcriptional regulator [Armatimonadota bacterium]
MARSLRIGRTTLAHEAYRALRSAILDRRLPAGRKLVVRVLAEDLGLSPTPIKEALAALEREGLVVAVPHRGYHVPQITPHDVEELYALREVVEGLAAARAATRGDERLAAQLDRLLERQRLCVRTGDVQHYGDLDVAFHRVLREASGNARLVRVAESFNGQIRLLISTSAQLPGRLPLSLQEHEAIVRAVKLGDGTAAETAMRHHVRQAGRALLAHLRAEVERGVRPKAISRRGPQEPPDAISTKTLTPPVSLGSTRRIGS